MKLIDSLSGFPARPCAAIRRKIRTG